jgi:hypothetical protein
MKHLKEDIIVGLMMSWLVLTYFVTKAFAHTQRPTPKQDTNVR